LGFTLTLIVPGICPPAVALSQLPPELVEVKAAKAKFSAGLLETPMFWDAGAAPPCCALKVSPPPVRPVRLMAGQFEQAAEMVPLIPSVVESPPPAYVPELAVSGEVTRLAVPKANGMGDGKVPDGTAMVVVKLIDPPRKLQPDRLSVSLPPSEALLTVTVEVPVQGKVKPPAASVTETGYETEPAL